MGLVEFLLARIAEDEKAADRAVIWRTPSGTAWMGPTPEEATLLAISGHRLQAECAAKRRLVEMAQPDLIGVLAALALPYVGHSDYDPAWNPEATQ